MLASKLLYRPQQLALRRVLFQVHLWVGIGAGLYVFIIAVTGSALVFREEIQESIYPELFQAAPASGSDIGIADVIEAAQAAYPQHQLLGIYGPSGGRETFVAWLSRDEAITPLFVDPSNGAVRGTLPEHSWLRMLQDLHFYLLGGRTGLVVNAIGAGFLALLCVTGLVIWWPGVGVWRRNLTVDFTKGWKRVNWDVHHAVGFWTAAFLLMWAVTGAYFAFPQEFRSFIHRFSPVGAPAAPFSSDAVKDGQSAPDYASLIEQAQRAVPGADVARISMPRTDTAPFQVVMAPDGIRESNEIGYVSFYFDASTGELLQMRRHENNSVGDFVLAWMGALHVGTFGGVPVKILWFIIGFAPAVLVVTGVIMWWNRVWAVRPNYKPSVEAVPSRRS